MSANPSLEAWREWVDLGRLVAWMDERGLEAGPIEAPARPPGGTQNLLLKFRRGETDFMLPRRCIRAWTAARPCAGRRGCWRHSPTPMYRIRA